MSTGYYSTIWNFAKVYEVSYIIRNLSEKVWEVISHETIVVLNSSYPCRIFWNPFFNFAWNLRYFEHFSFIMEKRENLFWETFWEKDGFSSDQSKIIIINYAKFYPFIFFSHRKILSKCYMIVLIVELSNGTRINPKEISVR